MTKRLLQAALSLVFGLAVAAGPALACDEPPCIDPEAPVLPSVDEDRF